MNASATARSLLDDVVGPDVSALVTEDDAPMDNLPSEKQQRLLTEPLYSSWDGPPPDETGARRAFVAAANVGLFSTAKAPPLVPDMMLSLDVELHADLWAKEHRSYFVWEFGKGPELALEIVSNCEGGELSTKLRRYERMRVPYYVVWDPANTLDSTALQVFELHGMVYVPRERPFFPDIGLGLAEWSGLFEGFEFRWLRWCQADGSLVPTGAERATREHERATREHERATREHERAERLAAKLRAMGIDPDTA